MKTDIKALLTTVSTTAETLAEDRAAMPPATINQQQLLGHTISGLRGIEGNLRSLLGEEGKSAGRPPKPKTTKPETESTTAS